MTLLIIVIVLALIFDYINGFHDAANSIATVVSTKVLTPFQAVAWAAFFNVIVLWLCQYGLLGFEFKVADTIAKIVKTEAITMTVILSGLLAAIFWNLLTWWKGIPSSSSHTLLGGFAGAAIAKAGFGVLADLGKIYLTLGFIFLAPLIGMILAYILTVIIMNICKNSNPSKANNWFKRLQLVSSAAFSLGHYCGPSRHFNGMVIRLLGGKEVRPLQCHRAIEDSWLVSGRFSYHWVNCPAGGTLSPRLLLNCSGALSNKLLAEFFRFHVVSLV